MTALQLLQARALRGCTFTPGSAPKRFVRQLAGKPDDHKLTAKQAAYLNRLAHTYRKQLGRCLAEPCEKCGTSEAAPTDREGVGSQWLPPKTGGAEWVVAEFAAFDAGGDQ